MICSTYYKTAAGPIAPIATTLAPFLCKYLLLYSFEFATPVNLQLIHNTQRLGEKNVRSLNLLNPFRPALVRCNTCTHWFCSFSLTETVDTVLKTERWIARRNKCKLNENSHKTAVKKFLCCKKMHFWEKTDKNWKICVADTS